MSEQYLNTAVEKDHALPVKEYHIDTPLEDYDLNYCFPVKALESDSVRLEPIIPSIHAPLLFPLLSAEPGKAVFRYLGAEQPKTLAEYLTFLEQTFRSSDGACNFVIYDRAYKHGRREVAGSISYYLSSSKNRGVDIGFVSILPQFQRTHVTTHAVGLLIQYALGSRPHGLGLRRVQWHAHSFNVPSQKCALRLGFTHEGILRFHQVLPSNKEGIQVEGEEDVARDNWFASITSSDWKSGTKQHMKQLMSREVVLKD